MPAFETVAQTTVDITSTLLEALSKKMGETLSGGDEVELFEIGELIRQATNLQRGLATIVKELRSIKKDTLRSLQGMTLDRRVELLVEAYTRLPKEHQNKMREQINASA